MVIAPPFNVYVGPEVGAVPIKNKGWLFIYVSANVLNHPEYTISAALLDIHDPGQVLAVTEKPLLKQETKDELVGVVNNVVSASGAVVVGDELYIYYGSGDQGCCLAMCSLNDLLRHFVSV